MSKSIVLDAGHGGQDNGAVFQDLREKDENLRIVLALGQELENRGIRVFYTRTTDIYQTPFEKAQIANQTGADYFLSIHRNSGVNPGEYSGVESLVYAKQGPALELAENINGALGEVGFDVIGVFAEPGIIVLRRTDMPAVLAEIGFINDEEDNRLVRESFTDIVMALADAVQETLDETLDQDTIAANELHLYRVQVGKCRKKEDAAGLIESVRREGFPVMVDRQEDKYRICVGNYRELENAITMERQLRKKGFSTCIVD